MTTSALYRYRWLVFVLLPVVVTWFGTKKVNLRQFTPSSTDTLNTAYTSTSSDIRSRRTEEDELGTTNESTSSTTTSNRTEDKEKTINTPSTSPNVTWETTEDVPDATTAPTTSDMPLNKANPSNAPTKAPVSTAPSDYSLQHEEKHGLVKEDDSTTIPRDYQNDKCSLEHFQENHWNCETHKFDHTCDTEALNKEIISGLNIGNIHFVGDSLSRNRYMTTCLEFSGKLPINDTTCKEDPRNLEHFIRKCRARDCLHKLYNRQHEVPRNGTNDEPPMTVYHDNALYNMGGSASKVIPSLQPTDVMFFSVGAWIDYSITIWSKGNRFKSALRRRPGRGEVIIWIGLSHIGHLKEKKHAAQGQNNSQVQKYNEHMKEHYMDYNMDGYIEFFNITKFSDDCARDTPNATKEDLSWANFDGTHSTGEPNRMMHVGLMLYLQQNLERIRQNQVLSRNG